MYGSHEFIRIEILFNSVETELTRRWVFHNVPTVFVGRPPIHLRVIVKSWWQIYHEAVCARLGTNRCIWERNNAYPAIPLDTPSLVASLQEIQGLVYLDDLLEFRSLSKAEEASICLLSLMAKYYTNPNSERWMQML